MSEYRLSQEIVALSESDKWDEARLEWELFRMFDQDDLDTCLCGHYPIKEICVLRNKKNDNQAIVGNCCVQKFMGISSDKLFAALKRVKKDIGKPFNADVIEFSFERGYISDWEKGFYLDTWRKRDLSEKQTKERVKINKKILLKLSK